VQVRYKSEYERERRQSGHRRRQRIQAVPRRHRGGVPAAVASVKRDEILCIVGPSGCGKTTFLRCIAGLTEINTGQLLVHGKPVAGPPDGVAMVFQHFGLLPWKTVYDNAAFGLAMAGASGRRDQGTRHALSRPGRTVRLRTALPVSALRRHAAARRLVRALAMNPSVLPDGRAVSPPSTPRPAKSCRRNCCN
jgi:ABC-type nitrate/sulfonate/bicarbonate transport system ATPase subunit